MPLLSRLLNNGATDPFHYHGRTDVIFPLEYHDLFQWYLNLAGFLGKTCCWRPPIRYLKVDPVIFSLLVDLVVDVLRRLAHASYGGNCLPGTTELRDGALAELGLNSPPPIYDFVRLFYDHQPFTGGSHIDQEELMKWSDWFMDAVEGTKRWLFGARLRALSRPNGWNWGPAVLDDEVVDTIGYDPRDADFSWGGSWRFNDSALAVVPHPVLGPGAHNAVVPYRGSSDFAVNASSPPCTDVIPHPVVGPGAQNALAVRPPCTDTVSNSCTALILHPVLGSDAQNSLILYQPPSATINLHRDLPAYDDPERYEVAYDCSTRQYLEQGLLEEGGPEACAVIRTTVPE